jgi:hypothetical protein
MMFLILIGCFTIWNTKELVACYGDSSDKTTMMALQSFAISGIANAESIRKTTETPEALLPVTMTECCGEGDNSNEKT